MRMNYTHILYYVYVYMYACICMYRSCMMLDPWMRFWMSEQATCRSGVKLMSTFIGLRHMQSVKNKTNMKTYMATL